MKNCLLIVILLSGCRDADTQETEPLQIVVGSAPVTAAVGDINLDGKTDIIVSNQGSHNATILLNSGERKFVESKNSPVPAGRNPNDCLIADFNNDGKPDVAFANHETSHVTVLLGDGSGAFKPSGGSPVPVQSRPHPHGITASDFNNDKNMDLAVESFEVDSVEILLGDGKGRFRAPGIMLKVGRMPYQRLRSFDINQDGNADIVTTNLRGSNLTLLVGNGKGDFAQANSSPVSIAPYPFAIANGDFNGDKNPDIAVAHYSGSVQDQEHDGVTVLLGDGAGDFHLLPGSPFRIGRAPVAIAAGDLNGDGIDDIATANYGSNDMTILLMHSEGNPQILRKAAGRHPTGVTVHDLDGDKKDEVVVVNSGDNDLSIFFGEVFREPR